VGRFVCYNPSAPAAQFNFFIRHLPLAVESLSPVYVSSNPSSNRPDYRPPTGPAAGPPPAGGSTVYQSLHSLADLRVFMEHHVFR
jgi:hypothetical protein